MRAFTNSNLLRAFCALFILVMGSAAYAQYGQLNGAGMVLSNGSNAITLTVSSSGPSNRTYIWPKDTASSANTQWIYDDGSGQLHWGAPAGSASSNTVLYNTTSAQTKSIDGNDIFNIGYDSSTTTSEVGALINLPGSGPNNSTYTGLTTTAHNYQGSTIQNGSFYFAINDSVQNVGSGTQTGITVNVSGSGTNYSVITPDTVGIGTNAPSEFLDVNGNLRISGVNGLKINGAANGRIGTVTLNGTTAVTVTNSSVTTSTVVFLTTQNTGGANTVGMPYASNVASGSFKVQSTQAGDNSTVSYLLIEP
jgi:hypothetical protein